jgi:hypothetical protein
VKKKQVTYDTYLGDVLPVQKFKGEYIGIELEYENAHMYDVVTAPTLWKFETDHSLRDGGIEFISTPIKPSQFDLAFGEATAALSQCKGVVNKRCGLHIHLNVSDLTLRQIWQVATYYTILEPFIFHEYARGREDSHFCVPTWANMNLQKMFYEDATKLYRGALPANRGGMIIEPPPTSMAQYKKVLPLSLLDNPKYSAMNFTCLPVLGTIEFRQHRSTTDMMDVRRWATFLLGIRKAALQYDNAEEIVEQYEQDGFFTLCEKVGIQQSPDVNPEALSDAVDAATMMVGHKPTDHTTLNWEMK